MRLQAMIFAVALAFAVTLTTSSAAFAETRTLRIDLGAQPCTRLSEGVRCERATFEGEREVQIDLDDNRGFSQVFTATQLSVPFDFFVLFGVKSMPELGNFLVQVFIFAADSGKSLAAYVTQIDRIDELNPIRLKSGQVDVSETESYAGLVSVSLVK